MITFDFRFKEETEDHGMKERRIFIREKSMKKRDLRENPMEMTLCARCVQDFYESPWHRVKRIDPYQTLEPCTRCSVRNGFDYRIYDYRRPVVSKEEVKRIREAIV